MPGGRAILGIDLRVTSVKAVEVEKFESGFALKNWGMTEVPYQLMDKHPQLEDAKADALRKLVGANKLHARDAVAIVGGSDVFVKLFTLADMNAGETYQAIKWKFAEEIPFPIEEALFDFYPLPKGEAFTEKVDYVAACINRKLYLENSYIITKAGLRLAGITVLPEALQEVFKPEILKESDKIVSVIYMGKRTTNISIFSHGNFEFNRELNIGGENITLAMSGIMVTPEGKVEISREQAEKIKVEHGVPTHLETFPKLEEIPLVQLQAMVRPALEKIQSELSRTFEYYKGQTGEAAVNKIVLSGGSSLTPNLKEFLGEGLGIPVVSPEPIPKLNPRLTAAVGAALVGTQRINLIPDEIKYRWKHLAQKFLKPQLVVPGLVALLSLFYLLFWFQAFSLNLEINSINRKLADYRPKLARLDELEKTSQDVERRKITLRSYEEKKTKMPMVFEEISRLIPSSANLNNLTLTLADVHLWGTVFGNDGPAENILSRFVLALSNSPLFDNVQLIQAVKNDDFATDAFNFELTAQIKEK